MMKYILYICFFLINVIKMKGSSDVKSSLAFVIDSSGSMKRIIDQVRDDANSIFDTVMSSSSSQIEDFVIVRFSEEAELGVVTKDVETFKSNLVKEVPPNQGGDCPEMALAGIEMALRNSQDASLLYIFTDASAKDYERFAEVEELSQKKRSQLVFVLTDDCGNLTSKDYLVYTDLAEATQGQVFRLGVNDIHEILNYIRNSIKNRLNVISSQSFPAGAGYKFDVDVDGDTKELVIAVAGENPSVDVTNADGTDIPTENITRLSEINVVKVTGVKPGRYQVEVGSDSKMKVVVSGTTTVHFRHGFSVFEPTAISDTATRPLPNTESYLSIKVAAEGNVTLHSIQLLNMDGNVVASKPLRLLDGAEQFYTTEPLVPPNHMFRIAIKGYHKESNTFITRFSLTPIKPQNPVSAAIPEIPPTVTIDGGAEIEADFGKPFLLKCRVSSYPAPVITWDSDDSATLSHTVSLVEMPYDYLSILSIKNVTKTFTYKCKATNKLNTDFKRVTVLAERKHIFEILQIPKDTAIETNTSAQVFCKASAFPPATTLWSRGRQPLVSDDTTRLSADNSSLTILSMEPRLAGDYTCVIRNDFHRKLFSFTISITGVEKPKLNKNIHRIAKAVHMSVDINCTYFKGKPKPTFAWYYLEDYTPFGKFIDLKVTGDTIHIPNVSDKDKGSYRCIATNVMGSDQHDFELFVEYPPVRTRHTDSHVTAREGDRVSLPCPVDGDPPPTFTWRRDGSALPPPRYTVSRDGTLRFEATLDSNGLYECEARNRHGHVPIEVNVVVIVPVDIESPEKSMINVMVGDNLELPCRARGVPQPTISWIFFDKAWNVEPTTVPWYTSGSLHLKTIQQKQSGFYTCVAKNAGSNRNITYTVEVMAPPSITYTKKEFTAVLDDYQLRIPCNASGNPKPTITWQKDGFNLASGLWYEMLYDGTLIIKNVDMKAVGAYKCTASNIHDNASETFRAVIKEYPDRGIVDVIWLELKMPATVSCDVRHQKTDRIRWFKDRRIISKGELSIGSMATNDAGIYTCRVSSVLGEIQTYSVQIKVGWKPKFIFNSKSEVKRFVEGNIEVLSCDTSGYPTPTIQWFHDDVPLNFKSSTVDVEMTSSVVKGRYNCIASNYFGSVQQEYNIVAYECKLDLQKDFGRNDPLIMSSHTIIDGNLHIPSGDILTLHCPATFKTIPQRKIKVQCHDKTQFKYHDKTYSYSDLKCRKKIAHEEKRIGRFCTDRSSEMKSVGFRISEREFKEIYKVCLDSVTRDPIYTMQNIPYVSANVIPEYEIEWTPKYIDLDMYDCGKQNAYLSKRLFGDFHRSDGYCFVRRQLVSPRDLAPGPPQAAAYTALNVAPQWGTCNKNWEVIEDRVRLLAKKLRRDLQVWTGTALTLRLKSAHYSTATNIFLIDKYNTKYYVPMYFWKVVQDPLMNQSLAIVQVNVPDFQIDDAVGKPCGDICIEVDWMRNGKEWRDVTKGPVYCCTLKNFEENFQMFRGQFPPRYGILKEIF